MCLLADTLNQSLEQLRAMQHCFKQGNTQLQAAITSISHDLRTPLTAICGYLELLEKEPLSAVSRQYVAIIRETHKGDDTTDGRTVPVFGCPVCAFGTILAGSVGKSHF